MEDAMGRNEDDIEEECEKVRHRRFLVWGVVPALMFLWGFALWVALEHFFDAY
jgi:hypothetical protein